MKSEIIASDGSHKVERKDYSQYRDPKFRLKNGKMAKHSEYLDHMRRRKSATWEVHSDGFLAIASPARECVCGGCCTRADGYRCPRCGRQN